MRMRNALTSGEILKVPQQTGRENVTEISDEIFSMIERNTQNLQTE